MDFTIVKPQPLPKPTKLFTLVHRLVWRVHAITAIALTIEAPPRDPPLPTLIHDYAIRDLVAALRGAADEIERVMAERRAEQQRKE